MQGTNNQPGVIPLTINYCFDAIQNYSNREFLFRVSYLEVPSNLLCNYYYHLYQYVFIYILI